MMGLVSAVMPASLVSKREPHAVISRWCTDSPNWLEPVLVMELYVSR